MYQPNIKKIVLSTFLIFVLFLLYSCEDSGTEVTNSGNGSLVVKATDAPFPIEFVSEASITISKIEARNTSTTEGSPFILLSSDTTKLNLINLRNGITADLAKIDVPAGNYDLIRLYIADASVVLKSGMEYNLTIPSGAQTGLKVFVSPAIVVEGGLTSELLLDFDVSKSFVVQGNPSTPAGINGFHLKPVIRAVNISTSGRLVGMVTDTSSTVLEDAEVWVAQDFVISFSFTNNMGSYSIIGLPAGNYSAFATKSGYDTVSVNNIEINAGNQTEYSFMLTEIE